MKRYLFLLIMSFFFYPPSLNAKNICYLPEVPQNFPRSILNETITKTLKINNYLVIFFFYDIKNQDLKDPYARFNFENTTKLAELKWGKTDLDLGDYFNENGDSRPYIFVETGGTIRDGWYKPAIGITRISTCYDMRKTDKEAELVYYFTAKYYEEIVDSIDVVFTSLITLQNTKEK